MHHTVGAFLIVANAISVPVCRLHELLEGLRVPLAEQVTRSLPSKYRSCRVTPRGAGVGLVACQKIEEQARLEERPGLAAPTEAEDAPKQLLGRASIEEVLLVRRALVGVARRHGDAVGAKRLHVIEEARGPFRLGVAEERAIDVDAEVARFRQLEGSHRPVIHTFLADGLVVHLAVTVEMDRPVEVAARLK